MEQLSLLKRNKRNKNVFDIFYNQNFANLNKVKKFNKVNEKIDSELLFLKEIPKTNEFENIPKIENDEIKRVDCKIDNLTNNEYILDNIKSESCTESIEHNKDNNIKLDINLDSLDIKKKLPFTIQTKDLIISEKKNIDQVKSIKEIKRKKNELKPNNIFKRFKIIKS